jgi:hypothetical protein
MPLPMLAPPSESLDEDNEWHCEPINLKGLRKNLLAEDQRSFFAGSAVADLQAAHVLNAVRGDTERKAHIVSVSSYHMSSRF